LFVHWFTNGPAVPAVYKKSISITIGSCIQNGTLTVVVATSIFHSFEMGIPAAVYAIWMFATGGFAMWHLGRRKEESISV
jgi:predicted Na+-dependent transporter